MRPLSIQWIVIAVFRNDLGFPLVHANSHLPIQPWRNRPTLSKRPAATTTTIFRPPLHSPRGGGQDVIPQHPSQSTPDDNKDEYPHATSRPSPYDYVPVTALDDYGQSIQLRHAMEAPRRYGTPVQACLCHLPHDDESSNRFENAILACSLQKPAAGIVSHTQIHRSSHDGIHHPSLRGMVHALAARDDAPPTHERIHAALVVSGLQSDARFLLDRLRRYCISKYWFRYDALPAGNGGGEVVRRIRRMLLDFMGYDWKREVGSASVSGGSTRTTTMATEGRRREREGRWGSVFSSWVWRMDDGRR
jgi:hypothetical protein